MFSHAVLPDPQFDVHIDAHLDSAEDFVLRHSHLHSAVLPRFGSRIEKLKPQSLEKLPPLLSKAKATPFVQLLSCLLSSLSQRPVVQWTCRTQPLARWRQLNQLCRVSTVVTAKIGWRRSGATKGGPAPSNGRNWQNNKRVRSSYKI